MTEQAQRAAAVAEARAWVATRYQDGARIKGECADCTFLAVVYENAGLMPHIDIPQYSPQAHLHRAGDTYRVIVERFAKPTETPGPGDMVLFWIGRAFSHGGIVTEAGWPEIIHASKTVGCILPELADRGELAQYRHAFFTLWPAPST